MKVVSTCLELARLCGRSSATELRRQLHCCAWRRQDVKTARSFQVTKVVRQMRHFFPQTSFLVVALKTQAANAADCFTVKMIQIKWTVTEGNIVSERERPSVCRLSV